MEFHYSKHSKRYVLSANLFDKRLTEVPAITSPPHTTLRTVHVLLMLLFWTLFVTLGRFIKKPLVYIGEFGLLVGFVIAIVAIGSGQHFARPHSGLGLVVIFVIVAHLILAVASYKFHSVSRLYVAYKWTERIMIFLGTLAIYVGIVKKNSFLFVILICFFFKNSIRINFLSSFIFYLQFGWSIFLAFY